MNHDFGPVSLGWALMGGVSRTINDVEIDEFDLSYRLSNYPLRTGLDLSGDFGIRLLGLPFGWQVFGIYTHLYGTELYLEDYAEMGGALRLVRDHNGMQYDRLRLQGSYLFGEDYRGYNLKLGAQF